MPASSTMSSMAAGAACEGVAPSGDLTAVRIEAANTTRTEPGLYEGPVWINDSLYFSDFVFSEGFPSRIQKLDASGQMSTAIEDSGSNGLAVDNNGLLVAGTHKYKSVSRYNLVTGERTSVAQTFNGNVFNSPNDIAITEDGIVYFTDPAFQTAAAPGGQEKTGVYRVALDGTVTLVDDTISNPNGITLSPNEDVLYVNGGGEQGEGAWARQCKEHQHGSTSAQQCHRNCNPAKKVSAASGGMTGAITKAAKTSAPRANQTPISCSAGPPGPAARPARKTCCCGSAGKPGPICPQIAPQLLTGTT